MKMVERAARKCCDIDGVSTEYWEIFVPYVLSIFEAIKYEDGWDDEMLTEVAIKYQVCPVTVSECFEGVLDWAIKESENKK